MNILVVDDEESILNLIRLNLEIEGYQVHTAANGREANEQWQKEHIDLIILDVMLPDTDGYQLLREFRASNADIPIIMLTAKGQINDKLLGLQLGADDYLVKPFHSTELLLRIKVIERRLNKPVQVNDSNGSLIQCGPFRVDSEKRSIHVNDKELILTYREYDLLLLLISNKQRIFTRDDLLMKVWKLDYPENTRAVDIMIQRLRKKLGNEGDRIKTIYGVGYKIDC
ncbi:XRE family transcriptional regulator [Paenibacillus sp. E194]|uniref:Response regulator transcription factor n=1 Tax=Paenibacillus popilliae TaxID=78057 RepID=A0ABY3AP51_PAEPP|nr:MULTISPECIES: response regulator transcription factor [Paenibacillus]KJB87232.1 XRE family transcriptional regulator [Paenibacillus sp. E194]TQR44365.1 response regulator transcription factor [Paenibacillus sp. SDF0028]